MRFPVVSILLIVTIIACPLWCASGNMACCAHESVLAHQLVAQAKKCCHCHEQPTEQRSDRPADDHRERTARCQGVCGGAVLEDAPQTTLDLDQIQPLAVICLIQETVGTAQVDRTDHLINLSGDNLGRSLRTLHASFLC